MLRTGRAWLVWWTVTLVVGLYATAGFVASYSNTANLQLEPGRSANLILIRLAQDQLRMEFLFEGDHRQRPELGDYSRTSDSNRTGLLKFAEPGSAIRIAASRSNAEPVLYEAMPKSGWGASTVHRKLTSNLSIERGVWQWPDPADTLNLVLRPGLIPINIKVVSVEAPLLGESVQLMVHPALGFKSCMPSVCWLWGWILWPVALFIQVLWAVMLNAIGQRRAREAKRDGQELPGRA